MHKCMKKEIRIIGYVEYGYFLLNCSILGVKEEELRIMLINTPTLLNGDYLKICKS